MRKVLRINLDGPFICCKAIVPAMLSQAMAASSHRLDSRKEGNPMPRIIRPRKRLIALTKSLARNWPATTSW